MTKKRRQGCLLSAPGCHWQARLAKEQAAQIKLLKERLISLRLLRAMLSARDKAGRPKRWGFLPLPQLCLAPELKLLTLLSKQLNSAVR